MAIKKAFVELVEFLQANKQKNVSTVLNEVIEMASAKSRGATTGASTRTALRDTDGTVVAIFDYYFKRWMPLVGDEAVEFGLKKTSATGYNSMCKEGQSLWSKQHAAAKKAIEQILVDVESGELAPDAIGDAKAEILATRDEIQPTTSGFETVEEVTEYLASEGVEFAGASETTED